MGNQKSCFVGSGSLTHYRFVTSVDPESLEHRVLDICFATATEVMEERSNKRSKRWGFRKSLRLRESLHQNQTGLEVFDKDGITVSLLPVLTNPDDPRNLQLFHFLFSEGQILGKQESTGFSSSTLSSSQSQAAERFDFRGIRKSGGEGGIRPTLIFASL
jgi:hypothetical protein